MKGAIVKALVVVITSLIVSACAGGGSPRVSYSVGVGYGGYYGSALNEDVTVRRDRQNPRQIF